MTLETELTNYLKKFSPALEVFHQLLEIGNVYAMGGLLREYKDHQKLIGLRDVDFCIETEEKDRLQEILSMVNHRKNKFNGYKLIFQEFNIDIWEIENTWAFRTGKVLAEKNEYFVKLPSTVFLNLDGLAYDLKHDKWNDAIYRDAMKKGELDVVLEENPFVELNIVRAMILKEKYHLKYSEQLKRIIFQYTTTNLDCIKHFIDIQQKRYGYIVLSNEQLKNEIEEIYLL